MFFNPFGSYDDQLREFATLSLSAGACCKGRSPEDLPTTLFTLFEPANEVVVSFWFPVLIIKILFLLFHLLPLSSLEFVSQDIISCVVG